ncbi:MAG TPA: Dyp-type peroxidase [Bryobacteraceae bacterium]|jgi:Dyp-type peroxidase family|nr:Dyp-type peroxidase [Bryobacteraceae bacterium]
MTKIDVSDIQGFALKGYNFPHARYLLLELGEPDAARAFLLKLLEVITTGERWDVNKKPLSTVNIAFTHRGMIRLGLPLASLLSFPLEFQQGMRARADILGDTGRNSPENWDKVWHEGGVHAWLAVNARSPEALEECCGNMVRLMEDTKGALLVEAQDACAIQVEGKFSTQEHFGYTDGFGNPDFKGAERDCVPGQGKLDDMGNWQALATGEFLLGYADEAGELPVAPIPHLLGRNGTFMVYRKLHQNVATFRAYLEEKGKQYAGGKEKLAAKFVGRWRDGTPLERSPDRPDPAVVADKEQNTNFAYGGDLAGTRCPLGSHIRRVHPRDAFGFNGNLVNRRRIMRRGLPYGEYVPEGQPVSDTDDRGIVFMALNASIFRQFEFVQQQWIEYGNDAHQGNDKDLMLGNHEGRGKFAIQGTTDPKNPPFLCGGLPNFVELRGGDYFFIPSLTALAMMATNTVDPR